MVSLGQDSENKQCSLENIIVDDVNTSNLKLMKQWYSKATVYVDKRFETPTSKSIVVTSRSASMHKILDKISKVDLGNESQTENFRLKTRNWCIGQFRELFKKLDNGEDAVLFIDSTPSKHECTYIKWLVDIGVKVCIISDKDIGITDGFKVSKSGTHEHLDYKKDAQVEKENTSVSVVKQEHHIHTLDEAEEAICENLGTIKLIISGVTKYRDTIDNFYGKMYKIGTQNGNYIFEHGFGNVTLEETNSMPRFNIDKHDYIVSTLCMYLKNKEFADKLKSVFDQGELKADTGSLLYNKVVYVVCTLNRMESLSSGNCTVVYYGAPTKKDEIVLSILGMTQNVGVVVLKSDKSKQFIMKEELDRVFQTFELEGTAEQFEMPHVDKREAPGTMAAGAAQRVAETLYNGDTLGMYRPGMFVTAESVLFRTAFEEIELWVDKDVYLRPGFEGSFDRCKMPCMFKVIDGVNGNVSDYLRKIKSYVGRKTLFVKHACDLKNSLCSSTPRMTIMHGTDVNGTKASDQFAFFKSGKLDKERIKKGINYSYGFMSNTKQDFLLDKVEEMLNDKTIDTSRFGDRQEYENFVLSALLNLDIEVLRMIQGMEFYNTNPSIILLLTDENTLTIEDVVLLKFMWSLGYDILVYVPTCYTSVENYVTNDFMYEKHVIGEAAYDVQVSLLDTISNLTPEKEKKTGWFNKLFRK